MLEFITENLGSIIVGFVVLSLLAGVILAMVLRKKKGKSSCGCGCDSCPMSGKCHPKQKEK